MRKGFTTTLFGDRNQLIWRGMRIYTWSGSGECHSDLNANRGRWLSAATFKTCQDGCRAARIPEMCGEGERRAAIKSPAPIYGRISRLSGQRRGGKREGSCFLHSVLTSLFLGVAHISRNDRIIFQTSAAVWLECPVGQRAFVRQASRDLKSNQSY